MNELDKVLQEIGWDEDLRRAFFIPEDERPYVASVTNVSFVSSTVDLREFFINENETVFKDQLKTGE